MNQTYLVSDTAARDAVRAILKSAPDMARALARLSVGRGGPRDLAGLRDGLTAADAVLALFGATQTLPDEIAAALGALRLPSRDFAAELAQALADDLPLLKRDGGFVRTAYDAALDETRNLRTAECTTYRVCSRTTRHTISGSKETCYNLLYCRIFGELPPSPDVGLSWPAASGLTCRLRSLFCLRPAFISSSTATVCAGPPRAFSV